MRAIFILCFVMSSCAALRADTMPIWTLKAIGEYAEWIHIGRITKIEDYQCAAAGFGRAIKVTVDVEESLIGEPRKSVSINLFTLDMKQQLEVGGRYVVAFQKLEVDCAEMSYSIGILRILTDDQVVTDSIVGEPRRLELWRIKERLKRQ